MAANDADRALSVYTLADLRFVASVRVGFVPRALEQSGWRILDVTGAARSVRLCTVWAVHVGRPPAAGHH
jgi:hypothetical protein